MHNLDERRAKNILLAQISVAVIVALVAAVFDIRYARDAFIGGLATIIGTAVFAFWIFGPYSAKEPGQLVARFYGGEILKIFSIVIVFAIAMKKIDDLEPVALFTAFLIVQVLPPLLANRIAR